MPADFAAALERAAMRREATPEPVVAAAAAAAPTGAVTATITSERPKPLAANEEAQVAAATLRAQGQSHDVAKMTSSAILFVTEPNAAADVWHGKVHASGGAAAAASAFADGQTKFIELTAAKCLEGSILVSIGRPAPSIYIEDEDEKPVAVPVEHELPDLFCFAVGYIGDRGSLWPRSGCVLAGMHNLEAGQTLGLLLDAHGGTPSITMYKNGGLIGRRMQVDTKVPGPLCWAVELPHRDDAVRIVAKPFPAAADVEQPVAPWLKGLDPLRSSLDALNRSWSAGQGAAAADSVAPASAGGGTRAVPTSVVGELHNMLNDPPVGSKGPPVPPPRSTNEWPS